jgi:hypothetical protein
VVERLSRKYEALSSNPNTTKKKEKKCARCLPVTPALRQLWREDQFGLHSKLILSIYMSVCVYTHREYVQLSGIIQLYIEHGIMLSCSLFF